MQCFPTSFFLAPLFSSLKCLFLQFVRHTSPFHPLTKYEKTDMDFFPKEKRTNKFVQENEEGTRFTGNHMLVLYAKKSISTNNIFIFCHPNTMFSVDKVHVYIIITSTFDYCRVALNKLSISCNSNT